MGKFNLADLLNDQSKQPKAQQEAKTTKLPLSSLRPSAFNKYTIEDIEELAASIEMVGLLHNLVVTAPDEGGIHDIVSGERRYWALKMLVDAGNDEFAAVDCRVQPSSDGDTLTELKLLVANALARDLSDYEKTYQAGRIKELLLQMKAEGYKFKGRMRKILADMMGVSPAQMGRMESINKNLTDDFKEEFKAGNIGISAAYDISTMPAEEQAAAHEQYKDTGAVPAKPKPTVEGTTQAIEAATAATQEATQAMVATGIAADGAAALMEEAKELARTTPQSLESAAHSIAAAHAAGGVPIAEGLHHPERGPTTPPAQSGPEPDAPQETRSIDHAVCPACGCTFNPADVVGSLDRIVTTADVPCPHCAAMLEVGMSIEWICNIAESEENNAEEN